MFDNNGNIIKTWNHINDCSKELKIETQKIMKMINGKMNNPLNLKLSQSRKFTNDLLLNNECINELPLH